MKTLGTLAIGLLLGMPPELRTAMFLWAQNKVARDGAQITPNEIYALFESLREEESGKGGEERIARLLMKALRGDPGIPPTESGPGKR